MACSRCSPGNKISGIDYSLPEKSIVGVFNRWRQLHKSLEMYEAGGRGGVEVVEAVTATFEVSDRPA